MNTWYSRADKPEQPDWAFFDLDPSDVGFPRSCGWPLLVKDVLDALGLVGLPQDRRLRLASTCSCRSAAPPYGQTREFAEIVAGTLARLHPGLVTTEWAKASAAACSSAPTRTARGRRSRLSTRCARTPAPGVDLRWEEVTEDLDPASFTMEVVLGRVERDGNLFADVLELKQALGPALRELT